MSRNFYILAATLGFFALISAAMTLVLAALAAALIGVMTHLFEQVDRRSEAARLAAKKKRLGGKH